MSQSILYGTAAYIAGAGALTWWLGGIFKGERATLGLPIEHLRAAEAWYESQKNARRLQAEVHAMEEAATHGAQWRHSA
ncbi:MAG: hypothetical protein ABI035_12535 [Gemmatimonadaceae bacterium]